MGCFLKHRHNFRYARNLRIMAIKAIIMGNARLRFGVGGEK